MLPVSIITGFLGSGKTALLNRLLQHPGIKNRIVSSLSTRAREPP